MKTLVTFPFKLALWVLAFPIMFVRWNNRKRDEERNRSIVQALREERS